MPSASTTRRLTLNTMILLIIVALITAAAAGIAVREIRDRQNSSRSAGLRRAADALGSGDRAQQRQLALQVLQSNPLTRSSTGRGLSVTVTLIGISLIGGVALLAWGTAGVIADAQYHHARPCSAGTSRNCLLAMPGTITGKDLVGHTNTLSIQTADGTDVVGIFGNIHAVQVGERATIQDWNGSPVFVDTPQGRFDTTVYVRQIELGLAIGLALIAVSAFFIWMIVRTRRALGPLASTLAGVQGTVSP